MTTTVGTLDFKLHVSFGMDENKTEQTIGGCEKTETIVMRSNTWMLINNELTLYLMQLFLFD